jgi:hypothetical protein
MNVHLVKMANTSEMKLGPLCKVLWLRLTQQAPIAYPTYREISQIVSLNKK